MTGPGRGGPTDRFDLERRHLYLCTPDRPDLVDFVAACIDGGVDVVQLREKALSDQSLLERAADLRTVCHRMGVPFIMNDRPDLAVLADADGVHVGQDDPSPVTARQAVGPRALVGLSTHSSPELRRAKDDERVAAAIDYVSAGPVVPTPTKPGRAGTGLGYITDAVLASPWPVWVTGGVTPASVPELAQAGARHFVVVRWLTEATDPHLSAHRLRRSIEEAIEEAGELRAPSADRN